MHSRKQVRAASLHTIGYLWNRVRSASPEDSAINYYGTVLRLYEQHGAPFGLTYRSVAVWFRYRQATTNN